MTNDPIADLLIRIKNGGMVKKSEVRAPHSKVGEAILAVMKSAGFIAGFRVEDDAGRKTLAVVLRYDEGGRNVISGVRRVSSPSRHVYIASRDIISHVRGKSKLGIISTSRGIMSHRQAREQNLGGELMGIIWS